MSVKIIVKEAKFRNKNDEYITPSSMVQQLLDIHTISKTKRILEPCCSSHRSIPNTLKKNGFVDVIENVYNEDGVDFIDWDCDNKVDIIITNIPYGIKNFVKFLTKMRHVAKEQIILLLPMSYLNGKERYTFYQNKDYPLSAVYPFTRFSLLTNEAQDKYKGGMCLYGWFVFKKGFLGDCIMKQINNDAYIITDIRGAYKTKGGLAN
jgi:type I restriction-modification system DNA methylase subunit